MDAQVSTAKCSFLTDVMPDGYPHAARRTVAGPRSAFTFDQEHAVPSSRTPAEIPHFDGMRI
ncbi:hypothetical protein DMH04_30680 [Kibdelosporangium aridum]|uniref:Uncharacterized protein n=1 Tax=Kibdelosporangium aridum TaxID=2030 RepID=A0A428Z2Q0_KIBAR|nr:hypothetical protein DMH04_30680 [Kibdelosporangium aridum]